MEPTSVIFVHGFISSPDCWKTFRKLLGKDQDFAARGYRLLWDFQYPTKALQLLPQKRIPSIDECGAFLRDYVQRNAPEGRVMLVGHSMGGLVIQSYLAGKIHQQQGCDLARIRTVVTFATPNRGSTMLESLRGVFQLFRTNVQDKELEVLNQDVAETSDVIVRNILGSDGPAECSCPIPFQVYWGLEDNVVPEVSARGPFVEAGPLPGDHSGILEPKDADDDRYKALKSALLDPVGHPAIYEVELWDVNLAVTPNDAGTPIALRGFDTPIEVRTDNTAVRQMRLVFSKQNRCVRQWEQMYRSKQGWVQTLGVTGTNEASPAEMSDYYETAKRFTYAFTPKVSDQGQSFSMKLRIYNGFGEGQRDWHDHLNPKVRCRQFRFTLNLKDFGNAGYALSQEPTMYFYGQDVVDHDLCDQRVGETPLPPVAGDDPWNRTWEMADVRGGVVDLAWDVKKPA
ncbi:MAG TPA: alpha/beta fold hydrolase [Acidobacteriaceae bacterium]|jgi:pimeloyl-ACP methyl ester carboxylesterase|nr:alpha/beta fold hydrolase [Acidobacteriaceae bacterium]